MSWTNQQANFIADGAVNQAIAHWHEKQNARVQDCATPSSLTDCPRMVWLKYRQKVPAPIPLGWGKAQRMLHGRVFENTIAQQLKEDGKLLWHWKDDFAGESVKFEMGEGETRICGTPDLLLQLDKVVISDAKTSMAKAFGFVPVNAQQAFKDYFWFKNQLQVESYFMLCHKNKDWFEAESELLPGFKSYSTPKPKLPLPEACHLFSYALDDGIVRREFIWTPTQETASKILYYTRRWNKAYASETIPDCTCDEFDGTPKKFCYYVTKQETTPTGAKLGVACCGDEIWENFKKEQHESQTAQS